MSKITGFQWVLPRDWWWLPDAGQGLSGRSLDQWAKQLAERIVPDVPHRKRLLTSMGAGLERAYQEFTSIYVESMRAMVYASPESPDRLLGRGCVQVTKDMDMNRFLAELEEWSKSDKNYYVDTVTPFEAVVPAGQIKGAHAMVGYMEWKARAGAMKSIPNQDERVFLAVVPAGCSDLVEMQILASNRGNLGSDMTRLVLDMLQSLTIQTVD